MSKNKTNQEITNVGEDVGNLDLLYAAMGI